MPDVLGVLIAEAHPLLRDGLLDSVEATDVVGEAAPGPHVPRL